MNVRRIMTMAMTMAATLILASGCAKHDAGTKVAKPGAKHDHGHAHPHEGPHEGALGEWGDEEFHMEFTVDHGTKTATVYVLDGSGTKAPTVAADKIKDVKLTISNVTPPVTLDLKHDAAKSDAKGIAFVGTHDALAKEMEFKGNVSGKVNDKPYSGDFVEEAHDHKHDKK